jgi:hypothetical protein
MAGDKLICKFCGRSFRDKPGKHKPQLFCAPVCCKKYHRANPTIKPRETELYADEKAAYNAKRARDSWERVMRFVDPLTHEYRCPE